MNSIAFAFLTKNRLELTKRTIEPLLSKEFHLWWIDGSTEDAARRFFDAQQRAAHVAITNVVGGADAAIVYALSHMLDSPEDFTHVGLVENDVLLTDNWFERLMCLFSGTSDLNAAGHIDGLLVGAASVRCYADRMLIQRDGYLLPKGHGYAVMHNLGAGMVLFTRQAAELILQHYRTGWTTHNRQVFARLSGIDIGRYWAFKGQEHWLTADWGFDRVLAAHGLASVACTPSCCEMIGQVPPLADQGLILVDKPIREFENEEAFRRFVHKTKAIRAGELILPSEARHHDQDGEIIFPHQIRRLPVGVECGWQTRWTQGFGPFSFLVPDDAYTSTVVFEITGPCRIMLNGGETGGKFRIRSASTGYEIEPVLQSGIVMAAHVPAHGLRPHQITVEGLTPGVLFQGIQCSLSQPIVPFRFRHFVLPPV